MRGRLFLVAIGLLLLPHAALGDQLTLKNGDRISGVIVKSDAKTIVIKSEYAGVITIQWDAVESLHSEKPLHITAKSGETAVGKVTTTAGKVEVESKDAQRLALDKESITSIFSEEEHAAFTAAQKRAANPGIFDSWAGSADTGMSLTRGNAHTTTFTIGLNSTRTTKRDKMNLYLTMLKTRSEVRGNALTVADARRGGIRYDVNLTPQVFAFGATDIESNRFQKLDRRWVWSGGLGWKAHKSESNTFDLFTGGAYNREQFTTGEQRHSPELLFGEESTHKFAGRTTLRQRSVYYPNLRNAGVYRFTMDSSAFTAINQWVGWQVTISERFLSNPLPGVKRNDFLMTTGLRFTLNNKKR